MTWDNIVIFFNPRYLFNPYPGYDMKFMPYLLIFFLFLVILSIVSSIFLKRTKKTPISIVWAHVYNWSLWIGIVGIILLSFRYEGVAFFSMRFLLFLWLVTFVLWGLYIVYFYQKGYKKALKKYHKEKEKERYSKRK